MSSPGADVIQLSLTRCKTTRKGQAMIRFARSGWIAGASIALAFSAPTSADVLEIEAGNYRTVAFDRAQSEAAANLTPGTSSEFDEQRLSIAAPVPVPAQWSTKIAELSQRFDLSPSLIAALVWQESRWRPDAVSPVGARGLAQLMPATARELGVDPRDPAANLEGGARYLRQQLDAFDGDIERALAAYNAGPGRVRRANGVPRIKETQQYVSAIVNRLAESSGR